MVNCKNGIYTVGRKGFTLLEIIVVVFILSLLVAIVAPKIMGRTDDAKIADAKVQIRNFETGLKLFKLDNGFYPDTQQGLDALIDKPTTGKIPTNTARAAISNRRRSPSIPGETRMSMYRRGCTAISTS